MSMGVTVMMVVRVMLVIMPCVIMVMAYVTVMAMPRAMTVAGIGTTFRIERRLDLDNAGTKPFHHGLDHMVMADAKPLADDLRRQVPVAEVPGQPHEMARISPADFEKMFRCSHNFDQPAILQHQSISAPQRGHLLKIEQEFETARPSHCHAAAMTVVKTKYDGISRRLGPTMMGAHLCCADHADSLIASGLRHH
jgi:hypothetical protein